MINENEKIKYDKSYNITLLSDITNDSYSFLFNNTFVEFKTIDDLYYIVYSLKDGSIICFDFYKKQKIAEIKRINDELSSAFRHYLDIKNKRDLILSIYPLKNNLRIWNVKNWECIIHFNNIYNDGVLYSACLLNENNNLYIIISNCNYFGDSELIKIFDFNSNKIKEINESNDATLIIDIFYDNINSKKYIITGNKNYLKSFDYDKNILYHKYYEKKNGVHINFIIDNKKDITKLIESGEDGNLRIWNFHFGILLNKIKVSQKCLYEICFLNENYLFVGSEDKTIKMINLINNKVIKTLTGHNNYITAIRKIKHLKYGECLISQGLESDQIKLWIINMSI